MVKHAGVVKWNFSRILCAIVVCASSALAESKPKVRLIATGGTIAGGRSGSLTAKQLRELVPELSKVADVSVEDFVTIGSSRMTPDLQYKLAERVNELFLESRELSGVVVTHGTDSLEETAFLLDLLVGDTRPVVFAAAMRAPREAATDGPRTLLNAVRLAATSEARGLGVIVTLNDEIHAARDVRKTHASALDAFVSPRTGPIGYFDDGRIYVAHKPTRRLTLDVDAIESRVTLIRLFSGSDGSLVRAAAESGQRGIVLEAFGRGNAPPLVMDAVREARAKGVVVVVTTRTGGGRVVLSDEPRRLGLISAEDLDGLKARLVLVAALGSTTDTEVLQSYYRQLAGRLGD